MLFKRMMKHLIHTDPGYSFDSVTEEIISDDEFKKIECITLTWQGCSIKIRYNGTIKSFLLNARGYLQRFNLEKYAKGLEKEKGFDHDTATETATEMYRRLHFAVNFMELDKFGLNEQKSYDQKKGGYIYIQTDENGNAAVGYVEGNDLNRHRVRAYVRVYGKCPTEEELSVFFGNLNGKPVNEAKKVLKAFADMTINRYGENGEKTDYMEIGTEMKRTGKTDSEKKEVQGPKQEAGDEEPAGEEKKDAGGPYGYCNW